MAPCDDEGHCAIFPRPPQYYTRPQSETDETDEVAAAPLPPPPPAPRARPSSHPIFYMEPGAAVGERVALHFFEPRYKLLVRCA